MRWSFAVLAGFYGLLVFLGWVVIQVRQPVSTLTALRTLEAGELLRDIAPSEGAYAKRRILAGERITANDFLTFPALSSLDNAAVLAVTVERALIDAGDVTSGKPARLCPGAPTDTIPVQAIFCTPGSTSCIAHVAMPAAKLQPYGEALKAAGAKAKLVRANAEKC